MLIEINLWMRNKNTFRSIINSGVHKMSARQTEAMARAVKMVREKGYSVSEAARRAKVSQSGLYEALRRTPQP